MTTLFLYIENINRFPILSHNVGLRFFLKTIYITLFEDGIRQRQRYEVIIRILFMSPFFFV